MTFVQPALFAAVLTAGAGAAMPAAAASNETEMAMAGEPGSQVTVLTAEWERAKKGALAYIDAMPEEHLGFKPVPEVRSFAQQWLHVAGANYMFGSTISGKKSPYSPNDGEKLENSPEYAKSKAALRDFVAKSYDFMIEGIQGLDDNKLAENIDFFKMKLTRSLLSAKALEHHAHHRGQTTTYLRLKGITPPSEMLF